ncbi:MAG: NAD(P)-dependent oxidoreductase [Chthoniobacterales bacterium]
MKIFITGGSGFIGVNFIEEALRQNHEVLNYSLTSPLNPAHTSYWKQGDILDVAAIQSAIQAFQPEWIVHFAARTDCDENTTVEKDYKINTDGTQNVLTAIKNTPSIRRAIITSSQYVCGPARMPENDSDYFPHTVYGQSKVITEKLTRAANLPCCWTLIRPTNIWGPWHERYQKEFWKIAAKGIYFHPGGKPVVRCYGYVGNVVHQIFRLLELPEEKVNGQTVYVSDAPDDIYYWADGFCRALAGKKAPKIPRSILYSLGVVGNLITAITGKTFFITTSRYRSMTTDYAPPMEKTFTLLGPNPWTLEEGIQKTTAWLKNLSSRHP